jgi:type II secretory ATPase GspE/PulE/Tfp pilus assembly ATPase PilB-like protein
MILRSVLRQDPDVIFVGEIRDIETATVAMQAAMTGHLVYTTVHSKDTIGAVFRLLDLGVEGYLVANALDVILAQRLVRVLCPTCKKAVNPTPSQNLKMGKLLEGVPQIYVPTGCRRCLKTGYLGRRAVFELLDFNQQMRDVVLETPTIHKIHEIAKQGLFMTLQQFGFQLVSQGATAFDEIERVAGSE